MRTYSLVAVTFALGLGITCPAVYGERLDDLDAPMDVFDDVSEIPGRLAEMPLPDDDAAADVVFGSPGALAREPSNAGAEAEEGDTFGDDSDERRLLHDSYGRELAGQVREGFIVADEFEDDGRGEPLLGEHEDDFHEEAGEDVDVEDDFDDEDDFGLVEGVE